jgi:hypothetical protein
MATNAASTPPTMAPVDDFLAGIGATDPELDDVGLVAPLLVLLSGLVDPWVGSEEVLVGELLVPSEALLTTLKESNQTVPSPGWGFELTLTMVTLSLREEPKV